MFNLKRLFIFGPKPAPQPLDQLPDYFLAPSSPPLCGAYMMPRYEIDKP
jgi:hypothetical protein